MRASLQKNAAIKAQLHAAKRPCVWLRDLQRTRVPAQSHLHAAQAVTFHHVDKVHVNQNAAMNLHELIWVELVDE
jgi:hypothetical protein